MENVPRPLPFSAFEWLLSGRYLRARRREGFISVIAGFSFLGIMLGVATLIVVMAVMNGFRKELIDKIVGMNGHLLVQPIESPLTDWKDVTERISQVPGIRLAVPVVDGPALASSAHNASGVLIRGIRPDDLNKLASIASNIQQGSLEAFEQGQGVAIGRRLADQLSLRAGDNITLVAPNGAVTSNAIAPRIKPYRVAAVFSIDMSEYDSVMVFLPLAEAQAYFNRADDVSAIEIFIEASPDRIDDFRRPVADAAERPVFLVDWRRRTSAFFRRTSGRAQRHVSDPDLDRAGRRAEHRFRPDHVRQGQGQRYRHPAHDRRLARRDHAGVPDCGGGNRRDRHADRFSRRHADLPEYRIDPAVPVLDHQY
jgi:lipoprotein-releasing system permease protein